MTSLYQRLDGRSTRKYDEVMTCPKCKTEKGRFSTGGSSFPGWSAFVVRDGRVYRITRGHNILRTVGFKEIALPSFDGSTRTIRRAIREVVERVPGQSIRVHHLKIVHSNIAGRGRTWLECKHPYHDKPEPKPRREVPPRVYHPDITGFKKHLHKGLQGKDRR